MNLIIQILSEGNTQFAMKCLQIISFHILCLINLDTNS